MGSEDRLKLIIPKGRIREKVLRLLARIGIEFSLDERHYRPGCSDPEIETKSLKPQNIPALVELGRHDCGFTGYDWVVEQRADVVELVDLGYDPVEVVVAVPKEPAGNSMRPGGRMVIASEYRNLTLGYIKDKDLDALFLQTYGATEAMPPEDADMIIDNTATGATLRRNRLVVTDRLMKSTTRFICNVRALENPRRREKLEVIRTLITSALTADRRVLLEMNVMKDSFERVVDILPCMRSPTVSPLHGEDGFAVKAAVPVRDVPRLIPELLKAGATDILEYKLEKIAR